MIRMFGHYIPRTIFALGLAEVAIVSASIFGATSIRYALADLDPPSLGDQLPEKLTFVLVFYLVGLSVGLYHRDTCRDLRMTIVRLAVTIFIAFVAMSVIFFLYPDVTIWRSIFAIAFPLVFVGILLTRTAFLRFSGHDVFKRRVLVLGAGPRAAKIKAIADAPGNRDFLVAAYVKMGGKERSVCDAFDWKTIDNLKAFIDRLRVDEIITAMEERRGSMPVDQLLACKLAGATIRDYSAFVERETGVVELEGLNPSWIVYSDSGRSSGLDSLSKRSLDIVASLLLLAFSLPILAFTAIAIKLTSRGPLFYRQERVGLGGKPFMLMKFRSMRTDAEADGAPQWAQQNDPRVTSVGRFIRLTRIDEIPQIFNVLKGDMSFVGPRPERPFFVESLSKELPYFNERHAVKPGITGWAQLNFPYGATTEDARQKLQYDLYYIKNCSFFFDLLILIQTARVILFPTGYAR